MQQISDRPHLAFQQDPQIQHLCLWNQLSPPLHLPWEAMADIYTRH